VTDTLAAQIIGTEAGDYIALLAYAPTTPETTAKLAEIQRQIRHYTRRAVTYGYGPRYLHSTGQLHKGGPANGVFFQLTHDDADDMDIPEAGYSFGVLKTAQAAGDMKALADHSRRAIRIHAKAGDITPALDVLLAALEGVAKRRQ
jgi:transaldolase/glucose-6-phosphate isomerase